MEARLIQEAIRRNVIIYAHTPEGKFVGMGSGVAIGKHYVLSVSHLFGKFTQPLNITVLYKDKKYQAELIKEDGGKDGLALLFVQEINEPLIKLGISYPTQQVLVYGNTPAMFDIPLITYCIRQVGADIISDRTTVYKHWFTLKGAVRKGFSGSAVYASNGLVGIVWGFLDLGGFKITAIVDIDDIIEFTTGLWKDN